MQNNNTSDIAYLGWVHNRISTTKILLLNSTAPTKNPEPLIMYNNGAVFIFDCQGTRYGFRIKELKK